MIDYYLLDATRQEYLLEYILNDIFGIMLEENKEDKKAVKQLSFFDSVEEKTTNFLSEMEISNISKATKAIFLASSHLLKKLEEEGMLRLYNEIEMPLVTTLASMEHTGMHVDKDKIKSFDIMISEKIEELTRKIYELAEEEFNINSTKQLGIILFEKLGLKGARKTKTGYSTDKEVLEGLESQHEIIPLLLEYRTLAKLKSTYVDSLASKIESDNRIHTTFMQTVTATGRLSSVEPNLQNIPIRQEIGGKIREFFTAKDEYMIIDADYSQIELRMLADISKDQTMIDAFNSNEDIHTITASKVFNVKPEEVTPELRRRAKAVNFGIVYGISEYGLAKNINSSSKEAKEYIQMYLEKYSKIADFMKDIVDKSKRLGYVSTIFGRRRYIKEFQSKNKNIIKFGERVAMNTPIQGSAADIIKLAMNRIYNRLKENNLKSKLIMQVHDELLIECPICEVDMASKILKEEMENVIKLSVPLTVDLNVGKNWYEAK
ncbi:dNA polymerase [Clostridium sp. CAG:1219]|nr:dNA polymerase [Clostridium sp. CAG:1219]